MRWNQIIAPVLGAVVLLAGCSDRTSSVDIDPGQAAQSIISQVEFRDTLMEAPSDAIFNYYLMDEAVEAYSVHVGSSRATAEEVAVLKVADKSDVSKAEAVVQTRLDDLKAQFENYNPGEMVKLNNAVIQTKDNVVYFITADDPQQAKDAIESLYK